jgi:carbon storage regulator
MSNGHLVLTRRLGESLLIGDDIEVTIYGISGGQVRIAVSAPREVSIVRTEIAHKFDRDGNPI